MSPSGSDLANGQPFSSEDLPYGPLPPRSDDRAAHPSPMDPWDPLFPLAGLEPDEAVFDDGGDQSPNLASPTTAPPASPEDLGESGQEKTRSTAERLPGPASELDVAPVGGEADDDVHFGVAAKALGVSRKTVERMVKRGQLERGPSKAPATVSKRSLVTVLEQRRREGGQPARSTGLAPGQTGFVALGGSPDATGELQELLRPLLEPLLEDFIAARTRAAVLESQMDRIEARATQERARDELLLALATGGWRQRRKARKLALRHYVLRDDAGT